MEGYLRIGLLLVGGVIIFLIIMQNWQTRSRRKTSSFTTKFSTLLDPDAILGLEPRDPVIEIAQLTTEMPPVDDSQLSLDFDACEPSLINEHESFTQAELVKPKKKSADSDYQKDLLVISIIAQKNRPFASYELLQALSSAGMQFGEMNIFHFYAQTPEGRVTLFSLASATEPGDFDLDRMGNFSCTGLTLFTNLREVPDPQQAFDQMVLAAEELTDDLGGELRAGMRLPWNEAAQDIYQQKVLQYQIMNHA